jgi:hypothetical protein
MNKEKFIELAYLYLLDELNQNEKVEIENAIMQDDELKSEFENIKKSFEMFHENKPQEANGRLLISARQELMRHIRTVSTEKSVIQELIEKIKFYFSRNYGYALGGAVTLIASISIAYLLFIKTANYDSMQNAIPESNNNKINPAQQNNSLEQSPNNFDNSTPSKKFISPSELKESLINALLGSSNPGIRIKTIGTISDRAKEETFTPDNKIKLALIKAMTKDSNPAVRKEALLVLQKYSFDNQIRDALLYVLAKDKNSGMRVAAINALADWNQQQKIIDEVLKQALTKQTQAEKNSFVKIRAASILKEVE